MKNPSVLVILTAAILTVAKLISYLTVCRRSMEGYGTISNLNALNLKLQAEGIMIPHEAEDFFTYTAGHLLQSWGLMLAYGIVFLIITRIVITKTGRENS